MHMDDILYDYTTPVKKDPYTFIFQMKQKHISILYKFNFFELYCASQKTRVIKHLYFCL